MGAGGNVGETEEERDKIQYTCGRRLVRHEGLITHGRESIEGDWPWYVTENTKICCWSCYDLGILGMLPFFT